MKILIPGRSGFIGTQVVDRLLAKGHTVLNLSLHDPHEFGHQPFRGQIDILDANPLRETMDNFSPDQVIHLAARTEMHEKTTA